MAQRRMFSKSIIESDSFMDMPLSTQALYFHLGMQADDDGFVSPTRVMRMVGGLPDDLKVLVSKNFVIPFESGVIVIKHWKEHNYIKNDRKKETLYSEELAMLTIEKNNGYKMSPECLQNGSVVEYSIGKVRLGKSSLERGETSRRFTPPSLQEVTDYCTERKNTVDPELFIDFYTSNGWKTGKNKMSDWKASVRTWEKRIKEDKNSKNSIDIVFTE